MNFGTGIAARRFAARRLGVLCSLTLALVWLLPLAQPQHLPGFEVSAQAQSASCRRMAAQIRALRRARPRNSARYQRAARRQQRQLTRTSVYAQRLGCNRRRFLFFGKAPPRQCGAINNRIARMRANLANLQQRSGQNDNGRLRQRAHLQARYDAQCRQTHVATRREPGFFDRLFGNRRGRYREMPIQPQDDFFRERERAEDDTPRSGSLAVCVRTCDGGFFPVSYSARRRNIGDLAELCEALCPNVEAKLYTYRGGRSVDEAVSTDGEPYSSLANAGKYKTTYTKTCTCKPPGKTWVQALQRAEKLLDNRSRRDVIVTAAKSRELSRAKTPKGKKKSRRSKREMADEAEDERQRNVLETAAKKAAVAQTDQAGISPGRATRRSVYSLADGEKRKIRGADGRTREVRIIAPKL